MGARHMIYDSLCSRPQYRIGRKFHKSNRKQHSTVGMLSKHDSLWAYSMRRKLFLYKTKIFQKIFILLPLRMWLEDLLLYYQYIGMRNLTKVRLGLSLQSCINRSNKIQFCLITLKIMMWLSNSWFFTRPWVTKKSSLFWIHHVEHNQHFLAYIHQL